MTKRVLVGAWMATPVAVWLGAFLLGWIGARFGGSLTWLIVGGAVGGLAGLSVWTLMLMYIKKRHIPDTSAIPKKKR